MCTRVVIFQQEHIFFSAMESPSTSDNEGKNSPPSHPALTIVTISKEHPHGLWRIDAKERRRSQSGNVMHRHPIDSPDCQEKDLRSLNGSQNKDKERIQQECKQGDHKEQLACTKLVHANQEAAETEGSEAKHDSRKDEKAPTELKKKEICLNKWWSCYREMRDFPNWEIEQLVNQPKSTLFRYLSYAEELRQEYGDWAVPTEERYKRRKYEVAAGVKELTYSERYDRKRLHDPKVPPRYNKRRKLEEQYEDYGQTWISRYDPKPCGCIKCMPCHECGKARCKSNSHL